MYFPLAQSAAGYLDSYAARKVERPCRYLNPKKSKAMPEPMSENNKKSSSKGRGRSSQLKYYIHDSGDAIRFQLAGELTEMDLSELNGCWCTAKTILGNRKLVIDSSGLRAIDEKGSQWLAAMVAGGANCVPDTFGLRTLPVSHPAKSKGNLFTRILTSFRSSRAVPAGSSTPAP